MDVFRKSSFFCDRIIRRHDFSVLSFVFRDADFPELKLFHKKGILFLSLCLIFSQHLLSNL
jgi:hypothetical protein